MKKEVIISIKGSQSAGAEQGELMEFMTEGKYYIKDGQHYITYKETEVTGLDNTTTTLKTDGKKVTLMRMGSNNSQFIFEQGKHYTGHYETPYGAFTIGVLPRDVQVDIKENSGNIRVNYSLELSGGEMTYNDFCVNFFGKEFSNDKDDIINGKYN